MMSYDFENKFSVLKHIGIVACSAEGAALCYRTICLEATLLMGDHNHPEITLNSIPMARHMRYFEERNWSAVAELLLISLSKVQNAGAAFAICPDNTCHQAFNFVRAASKIPWLHIVEVVAEQAHKENFSRVGILGTKYITESSIYSDAMAKHGIMCEFPDRADRERINTVIFNELVHGIYSEDSRLYFNEVIEKFGRKGADAVVLGCTEIPLLIQNDNTPLPILDSTRLLARAALRRALLDETNEAESRK